MVILTNGVKSRYKVLKISGPRSSASHLSKHDEAVEINLLQHSLLGTRIHLVMIKCLKKREVFARLSTANSAAIR